MQKAKDACCRIADIDSASPQLIDPTIFEARFRNFRSRLGHCVDSSFEQNKGTQMHPPLSSSPLLVTIVCVVGVTIENGVKTANEEKKFFFERGAALVSLEFVNEKLVEFAFDTEGIGNVLPEIPVSDLYSMSLRRVFLFSFFFF